MNGKISREPSEAALAIDRSSQAPPADPKFEVRTSKIQHFSAYRKFAKAGFGFALTLVILVTFRS
jgi:hypothetical protein